MHATAIIANSYVPQQHKNLTHEIILYGKEIDPLNKTIRSNDILVNQIIHEFYNYPFIFSQHDANELIIIANQYSHDADKLNALSNYIYEHYQNRLNELQHTFETIQLSNIIHSNHNLRLPRSLPSWVLDWLRSFDIVDGLNNHYCVQCF